MTTPIFSPSWYRVAALTPKLRSHARIHRHRYRGQVWYVLQDLSTDRFHRFSPAGYFVAGLMDGRRTVQEIWEIAAARLGDDAPTQEETIQLLGQLHATDILQCDVPPDTAELLRRYEQRRRRKWQAQLLSPFTWKIPLVDPERFLARFLPVVRPLTGWTGGVLWLLVVVPGVVLAGVHWGELTENFIDRVLTPQNAVLLWIVFPVVKALHELGHAFLTKAYGGEVHDMGVMILVLTPVPYVDASAAWAFREKWRRVAVGAAGVVVEVFLASLALFVWLSAEPGAVRSVAYNVMLVAGVSTILFNANPLLRYDGYYILSDLLEIPNLRARANAYLGYLCERYLFGRQDAELPPATAAERAWFVLYAVASFAYRTVVVVAIVLFLADRVFLLAVLLGMIASVAWLGVPAGKGLAYLFRSPRIRTVRARAIATTLGLIGAALGGAAFVPLPLRSEFEGVVWIPDEALVRAGAEGFIEQVVARPGDAVRPGDDLVVLQEPSLATRARALEARRVELEARYLAASAIDRVKAEIIKDQVRYAEEALARTRERAGELTIRSRVDGVLVVPGAENLPGRFVRQGDLLGYVVDLTTITIRMLVPQSDIDLMRYRTQAVEVRLAERLDTTVPAEVVRIAPGASEELPSPVLGSRGGGRIAVDPRDPEGHRAVERFFQVDLRLPPDVEIRQVGGRAFVRLDHGWEPLVYRWYRSVRQLFATRFHV